MKVGKLVISHHLAINPVAFKKMEEKTPVNCKITSQATEILGSHHLEITPP